MKHLIIAVFGVFWGMSAWGQGTLNFSNGAAGVNAPVSHLGSNVSGPDFVADLYYGAQGAAVDSLTPLGANVAFATGGSAGYFFGGARAIPGHTGTVTVQVRVWRVADGSSYEQAVQSGGVYMASNLFDVTLATGAVTPPNLVGLQPMASLVPEPTVFAFSALGIATLLMGRRRKA